MGLQSQLSRIEKEILATIKVTKGQLELLRKQDKQSLLKLYSILYEQFEADKELEEEELEILQKIQEEFSLTMKILNLLVPEKNIMGTGFLKSL